VCQLHAECFMNLLMNLLSSLYVYLPAGEAALRGSLASKVTCQSSLMPGVPAIITPRPSSTYLVNQCHLGPSPWSRWLAGRQTCK
jgi:hypothetical protein